MGFSIFDITKLDKLFDNIHLIAFVRKHYTPEGIQNCSQRLKKKKKKSGPCGGKNTMGRIRARWGAS